jgi:stage V sporulation protein D (sporulation-specific penicillin-binding protein)
VLFVLLVGLYVLVGGRLVYVQVVNGAQFQDWGSQIRFRKSTLHALRGCIYDRDKRVLAVSIEAATVFAHRPELKDIPKTAQRVAEMMHADPRVIEQKLRGTRDTIWIAKRVDPRIGREIKLGYKTIVRRKVGRVYKDVERREKLPGIGVLYDTKRVYPSGAAASQVLGFVNSENVGAEGLERVQNEMLKGTDGRMTTEVDAQRREIPETCHTVSQPVNGRDIVLTIDTTIQQIAEEALEKMAQTYHPESACAVVLDPKTGEILALANYPGFDPNASAKTKPVQWRNRAVADLYEPGSTLKVVTVSAAANEGIDPHAIVANCAKTEKITGGKISCTVHHPFTNGHGAVDMYKIIQYSCNIGAAHLAFKLGADKLYRYEKAFGLVDRMHAGFGCEAVGRMLPPEDWRVIRLANIGFGQGIAVTPLQMAAVYGTIANGGIYNEPRIVQEIRNADGTVVKRISNSKPRRVVTARTASEVKKMLMICAEEGTGKPAQIEGRTVAGKTGSAQIGKARGGYESGSFIASFMGFAPASKPRLVIAVVVRRPQGSHWGATVAAPVFKEIGEKSLWYLKVPSDAPIKPKTSPKPVGNKKGLV